MKRGWILTAVIAAVALAPIAGPAAAQSRLQRLNPFSRNAAPKAPPLTTFMPDRGFEEWVASNLDIRSFNSSIDGRREAYQARLREVGYAPVPRRPGRGPVVVSLASPEGDVALSVFQRGDLNRDGIEDVLVCFEDSPKNGRFHQVQPLLAQKYTANGPLVALDIRINDPRCRQG